MKAQREAANTKVAELAEAQKELEAVRKDAERYRKWKASFFIGDVLTPEGYDLLDILLETSSSDKWDSTIDSAIAAEKRRNQQKDKSPYAMYWTNEKDTEKSK